MGYKYGGLCPKYGQLRYFLIATDWFCRNSLMDVIEFADNASDIFCFPLRALQF